MSFFGETGRFPVTIANDEDVLLSALTVNYILAPNGRTPAYPVIHCQGTLEKGAREVDILLHG